MSVTLTVAANAAVQFLGVLDSPRTWISTWWRIPC